VYLEVEKCTIFHENFAYTNLCSTLEREGDLSMAVFLSNKFSTPDLLPFV